MNLEKRVESLEAVKDDRPLRPLHIYRQGTERVPEKPCHIKNGKIPPMVIVHEAVNYE